MNNKQWINHLLGFSAVLLLSGCASVVNEPKPDDPSFAPVMVPAPAMVANTSGSIYQGAAGLSLFEDRRAHRVGDILTVVLSERTSSSKTAETEINKTTDLSIVEPSVLGRAVSLGKGYSLGVDVNQDRAFSGDSASDQSNRLQGSIAVTVSEVLPNGLLVVRGEKWMTLTSGEEFIRVRGLVRPEDVLPDNSVLSTKLADARIAYSGTGEFADSNRQGWASRFFNSVFWPF